MGLNAALQIGRSAILSSQAAMTVAGNNMANAVTPGFSRRTIHLSALQGWGGVGQGMSGWVEEPPARPSITFLLPDR